MPHSNAPQTPLQKTELLYDHSAEHSSCGVGFITRKDGRQSRDIINKGHEALCAVPHRGGMSSAGVGDGVPTNFSNQVASLDTLKSSDPQV